MKMKRECKCGCGSSINHKHPNAKFINKKHKDRYHNLHNPRGMFAHLAEYDGGCYDPGDSEYWDAKDN